LFRSLLTRHPTDVISPAERGYAVVDWTALEELLEVNHHVLWFKTLTDPPKNVQGRGFANEEYQEWIHATRCETLTRLTCGKIMHMPTFEFSSNFDAIGYGVALLVRRANSQFTCSRGSGFLAVMAISGSGACDRISRKKAAT